MSETAFPINDLLRRRLQTGLTVISLTACVASTLFLLVFSSQIGFGIAATTQNTLTAGTSAVFGQMLTFVGALIFAVGAVIVSFIVYLMMAQRTKDFGLMKSAGCPNGLVFGYFMTQLLGVTFVGCLLGVVVGYIVDFAVINMDAFRVYNSAPNFWFAPLVFAAYFAFALIFGARPILKAARMSPLQALSSAQYFGLTKGAALKPLSRTGLTLKIASRSLFRRKSATVRITIFISVVFLLLTVSIAGGIIANDTSNSWVKQAMGENTILIAKPAMADQYTKLLTAFSEGNSAGADFNYSDPNRAISPAVTAQLAQTSGVKTVDQRLLWYGTIQEISGFTKHPDTLATITLGDSRKMDTLIEGIDGANLTSVPYTTGTFLNGSSNVLAVVGDSVARTIYSPITTQHALGAETIQADALRQGVRVQDATFSITGISLEPINNGNVIFLPLATLQNITSLTVNVVLVSVDSSANYQAVLDNIKSIVANIDSQLQVVELNQFSAQNTGFLNSLWAVILFLPAFALASATLALMSFQMLTIDEQHQEFAILRATGAKPTNVVSVLAVQSLIVLLASFGVGTSLGTIICILILTTNPVVSALTVASISAWLLAALAGMFLISLYPAVRFARKPLLKIMS